MFLSFAESWQFGLQDAASPIMEAIVNLHDTIIIYIVLILTIVFWLISYIIWFFGNKTISHKFHTHGTLLEIIWTIAPAFILLAIALPSFRLLYIMDEVVDPAVTIKTIGHQWYWSYSYGDYKKEINFDSYIIPTRDLELGQLRLLQVDNQIVVPTNVHVRFIITAADVLHCWAVPALGVKADAVPGRLNQSSMIITRPGLYYGQCSEICGVNHAFIPIVVQGVDLTTYVNWINKQ